MSNPTAIDPNVTPTELNPQLAAVTLVNPCLAAPAGPLLSEGTLLAGKYRVISPMDVATGEADLYLCAFEGQEYVAKVYRRQRAVKPEVIAALQAIHDPRVAAPIDTGILNDLPFEILPYYQQGSLQGKRFSLTELRETIIPALNEALHALHQNGVLHKDLKPSNIMQTDDLQGVVLIDFGVSSAMEPGSTVLLTRTGMTPEYSAPETFRGLFLEESDYYSLGITLYELHCGTTPYHGMSAEDVALFTAVQRIPFPEDMPRELRDLIAALTYFDITSRHDKENSNRRWTYDEVNAWLQGLHQTLPGEGFSLPADGVIPPYSFLDSEYTQLPELVTALARSWQEGKKQLYRGHLAAYFRSFHPKIAEYCRAAEEEAAQAAGRDDIIFWELLYRLYPGLAGIYWKERVYESPAALGREMLELLWKEDLSLRSHWDDILANRLLSGHLSRVSPDNPALIRAVSAIEAAHCLPERTAREALMNYYTLAYLLSGQHLFHTGETTLKSIPELTAHMKSLLDISYETFENFCHRLIDYDDTLDVQFEAWLVALGKHNELAAWRRQLGYASQ